MTTARIKIMTTLKETYSKQSNLTGIVHVDTEEKAIQRENLVFSIKHIPYGGVEVRELANQNDIDDLCTRMKVETQVNIDDNPELARDADIIFQAGVLESKGRVYTPFFYYDVQPHKDIREAAKNAANNVDDASSAQTENSRLGELSIPLLKRYN